MDQRGIKKVNKYLVEELLKNGIKPNRIILFGSAVKLKKGFNDLDYLVVSSSFNGKDIFERAEMTGQVNANVVRKFRFPIDLVSKTPAEFRSQKSLICRYAAEGKTVYPN